MSDFNDVDDDDDIITLVDENGAEVDFLIIDSVSHKGNTYFLVTPAEDDDDDSDAFEAAIFKEVPLSGDEVSLETVEDENEFNEVAALFMENADDYGIDV